MSALIRYFEQVNLLKRLPRMGWLLAGVTPCESVADHTCAVALLVLGMAEEINLDWAAAGLEQPMDVGRAMGLALVHDLAESVLIDLPKGSTALIGSDVKHAAEATAIKGLFRELPNGATYVALWGEYGAASTPEARLVRDADRLEMVHQALFYEQRGQRNLDEFWLGHHWHFTVSARLFETLRQSRR